MVYERFCIGRRKHFLLNSDVDFVSDAAWKPGERDQICARDLEESEKKNRSMKLALLKVFVPLWERAG